jgi:hypothetical protein
MEPWNATPDESIGFDDAPLTEVWIESDDPLFVHGVPDPKRVLESSKKFDCFLRHRFEDTPA